MSGKRSATSELNHDNWDRDDEAEEQGTFKKASEDVLKRRIIKSARRRGPATTNTNEGDGDKKSIFGGFTAFAKTPANPSAAFSFLNTNTTENTPKPNQNGTSTTTDKKEVKAPSKNDDYYAKLKGLNESVSKWIKTHVDENPFINLKPIFADYEKYFSEIDSMPRITEVNDSTKQELGSFSFKSTTLPVPVKEAEKKVETPQFSFGMPKSSPPKPATGLMFGGATNTAFSFGGGNSAPFTFKNVSAPPVEAVKKDEETNDDEDEPPKVEFTPVVEDGHVYTIRCKVFVKKDGNFGDRGVGNLFLKPVDGKDKVQLIVRADTNLGNLLCNFILSDAIPTQRMGKKDVMLVCIPTPDCKPPPVPILLRVKSPEEADVLLKTLEKHKK